MAMSNACVMHMTTDQVGNLGSSTRENKSKRLTLITTPEIYQALCRMAGATACGSDSEGPLPGITAPKFASELLEVAIIDAYEKRFRERICPGNVVVEVTEITE